jgi:muramoyltetrapeptide carboxypeptidase
MTSLTATSFQREICAGTSTDSFVFRGIPLHNGKATGRLIGGNLTTLQQLIGTPYEPDWENHILFWEDVCEQPHVLDAKLTHFRNAGVFQKIAGMIVGVLEECVENDYLDMPPIEQIVLELTEKRFPIIAGIPLGHTDNKLTLPIGINVLIDGAEGTLTMEEKGVIGA